MDFDLDLQFEMLNAPEISTNELDSHKKARMRVYFSLEFALLFPLSINLTHSSIFSLVHHFSHSFITLLTRRNWIEKRWRETRNIVRFEHSNKKKWSVNILHAFS
jgi:hypothetical protein